MICIHCNRYDINSRYSRSCASRNHHPRLYNIENFLLRTRSICSVLSKMQYSLQMIPCRSVYNSQWNHLLQCAWISMYNQQQLIRVPSNALLSIGAPHIAMRNFSEPPIPVKEGSNQALRYLYFTCSVLFVSFRQGSGLNEVTGPDGGTTGSSDSTFAGFAFDRTAAYRRGKSFLVKRNERSAIIPISHVCSFGSYPAAALRLPPSCCVRVRVCLTSI